MISNPSATVTCKNTAAQPRNIPTAEMLPVIVPYDKASLSATPAEQEMCCQNADTKLKIAASVAKASAVFDTMRLGNGLTSRALPELPSASSCQPGKV